MALVTVHWVTRTHKVTGKVDTLPSNKPEVLTDTSFFEDYVPYSLDDNEKRISMLTDITQLCEGLPIETTGINRGVHWDYRGTVVSVSAQVIKAKRQVEPASTDGGGPSNNDVKRSPRKRKVPATKSDPIMLSGSDVDDLLDELNVMGPPDVCPTLAEVFQYIRTMDGRLTGGINELRHSITTMGSRNASNASTASALDTSQCSVEASGTPPDTSRSASSSSGQSIDGNHPWVVGTPFFVKKAELRVLQLASPNTTKQSRLTPLLR